MLTSEKQEQFREYATSSRSPLVAISILNWNGWQDTLECLEPVRRLDYPNYLTVVVDNGSWNGSADKIKAWAEANLGPGHVLADYSREMALAGGIPDIEQTLDRTASPARMVLVRNEENLGFTGGNNVSIHYALQRSVAADYVFLLNNDACVSTVCVSNLLSAMQKAGAGIAEATIFSDRSSTPQAPCRPLRWQKVVDRLLSNADGNYACEFVSGDEYCDAIVARGAAVLIRGTVLRQIFAQRGNYLRQEFFMYHEDCEISLRIRKLGFPCVRANKAAVWHKEAGTAGGRYNPLTYYYIHRNRLLLSRETSAAGKLHAHLNSLKAIARVAKCVLHNRYSAAFAIICGVLDGYRGVTGKWKYHARAYRAARNR